MTTKQVDMYVDWRQHKLNIPRVHVKSMTNRSGRAVPNQFTISTDKGNFFQSYRTIIAFIDNDGKVYLDENSWDHSTTTSKYRNIFLNEKKPETLDKIKSGEYVLTNLN